ncbi:MAG: glycosyltransferase family 4 protein [Myxococcota bacterium]|jgi:glycosyltransferase involved in cell wall biosynthesis|nr:glycosyltransferase family 4 protein [Myxococcota bacterium]
MATKLGYLIPQFPGQTHIFFWREILELERRGVEVALFSTRPPPRKLVTHRWSEQAIARTHYLMRPEVLDVARLGARFPLRELREAVQGESRAHARDVALSTAAATQLAFTCRQREIEHVHVHSCGRAALIAALAHRMFGLSYSLTLHGPLKDYGPGQRFKWKHARFVTVITKKLLEEVRVELGHDLPTHVFVRGMGVDTEQLRRTVPYVAPKPGETLRLFSCGRLNPVKGHLDLLAAVRRLIDEGRAVSLEIAGEDDEGGTGYRRLVEARIVELGIEPHVRLLGAVDADCVRDRLSHAHLFVLASLDEALGVALMEAMSCEVPTIGTATGGVAELIRDGIDGILIPPANPDLLARTIAILADDREACERFGTAGRARVVDAFQAGAGADTLIEALRCTSPRGPDLPRVGG